MKCKIAVKNLTSIRTFLINYANRIFFIIICFLNQDRHLYVFMGLKSTADIKFKERHIVWLQYYNTTNIKVWLTLWNHATGMNLLGKAEGWCNVQLSSDVFVFNECKNTFMVQLNSNSITPSKSYIGRRGWNTNEVRQAQGNSQCSNIYYPNFQTKALSQTARKIVKKCICCTELKQESTEHLE